MAQVVSRHDNTGQPNQLGQPHAKMDVGIDNSSWLMGFSYDPLNRVLQVNLKSGAVYSHSNIPQDIVDQWLVAPSKGRFYAEQILGTYQAQRTIDKRTGAAKPTSFSKTSKKRG